MTGKVQRGRAAGPAATRAHSDLDYAAGLCLWPWGLGVGGGDTGNVGAFEAAEGMGSRRSVGPILWLVLWLTMIGVDRAPLPCDAEGWLWLAMVGHGWLW
jgi:hypothetical protein